MLNHNKRSITLNTKTESGRAIFRASHRGVRRAGRELRAGGAGSHGLFLGAHPGDQSANHLRLGQGIRPGPLRGLQGLRERRPVHRRRREHHRLRRRPSAGDGSADRRLRHRAQPGARHRHRALPPRAQRPRPAGDLRDAGRGAEPLPGEAARSAAPRPRAAPGVPAVSERRLRQRGAALRQRIRRRAARLGGTDQGVGDGSQRLHIRHHPGRGLSRPRPGHRA